MTKLEIELKVWECCDMEPTRYVLSAVKAIPKTGGGAWLVATDGRCLTVTPVDGVCDAPALIPAEVIKGPLPVVVSFENGEWRNNRGRVAPATEGKFPDISKTFAAVKCASIKGRTAIAFNPQLATSMRNAIQEPEFLAASMYVTDRQSAIAVLGEDGFGLLMPMDTDGCRTPSKEERAWRERTKAFLADWKKAHPVAALGGRATRKQAAKKKATARK